MPGEFLRVTGGNAAGTQIPVGNELLIGRAASGAGTLGDDPEISRNHARVSYGPAGQLQVEDLGSTNGTYVNGRRIAAPTPLNPGDTVQMGKSTLQVLDAGGRAPQATAFGTPPAAAAPPPPPPPPPAPGGFPGGPQAPPTAPLGAPVAGGPTGPVGQRAGGGDGGSKALIAVLGTVLAIGALVGILFAAGVIGGGDDTKKASNTTATTATDGGGGDAQAEDDVKETISTYLEDNDCRTLTDSYLSELFNQAPSSARQACTQAVANANGLSPSDYTIKSVAVTGNEATADVEATGGSKATYKLVKDGEDWKINSIRGEVSGAMAAENATQTEMAETTEEDPQAQNKLEAEATLIAFIKAVRKSDEQVVCGLLTPRQAQRLVGGPGGDAAIVRCLEVLKGRDLSDIAKPGLAVSGIVIRGNQASVRLNDGTRVTLVKRDGQYRIDRGFG